MSLPTPVAGWNFNDSSADVVGSLDLAESSAFAGNYIAGLSAGTGNAIDLDGVRYGTVAFASLGPLNVGDNDFSIAVWVKAGSSTQSQRAVVELGNTSNRAYRIRIDPNNNRFRFEVSATGSDNLYVTYNKTITAGTWYHVVVRFTASTDTIELIVDNDVAGKASRSDITSIHTVTNPDPSNYPAEFCVGVLPIGTDYSLKAQVAVDNLYVFAETIDDTAVGNLYNSGAGRECPWSSPTSPIAPPVAPPIATAV